jgi:hypothetical protein
MPPAISPSGRSASSSGTRKLASMTSRDKRFLHTPPYAFELGLALAAGAVWKLLTRGAREESDEHYSGSDATPPERTQA